ncbi:MAG: hypothetical protein NWR79_12595, partial [Saprospiraceae bacterium]|nr:hypothetical protein [Saprospiraceae bacterium]MDP4913686.1 hypothetical protein [Saprospiraceae bacterium]
MDKSINNFINVKLHELDITDYNDQIIPGENVISFKKEIDNHSFMINIIYQSLEDMFTMRLICTYIIPFKEPGKDFYQILEKLSSICLLGYLSFSKENGKFFISYNSKYISKKENFFQNDSLKTHLKVSFDMIGMNYREIFDKK